MARKCYTPEGIIQKLREAEVLLSQGQTVQQSAQRIQHFGLFSAYHLFPWYSP